MTNGRQTAAVSLTLAIMRVLTNLSSFFCKIMCKTDGRCTPDSSHGYNCSCQEGFSGKNCEVNHDDCIGVVCENGGVCRDGIRDFSCKCKPGYSGRHCENRVDLCRGFPCANGGTCHDVNGVDFTCACAPGFTGKHCSIDINDCDPNPCLNNGVCHDRVNEYACSCPPGFSGTICQFSSNASSRPQSFGSSRSLPSSLYFPVRESSAVTEGSPSIKEESDRVYLMSGVILSLLILIAVIMGVLILRSRRMEKTRRRDEELARSQNEANSRSLMKKKCLDNDPFKGQMIVNSLTDDTTSSIHGYSTAASVSSHNYNLNRQQSLALSKSMTKLTNCEYESNLKLACKQQHQPNQGDYGKIVSLHPSSSSSSSSCKKSSGVDHKSQEVVRFPPHTLHRINCPRKGLNQQPQRQTTDPDVIRCNRLSQQHVPVHHTLHHQGHNHVHHGHHHPHGQFYAHARSMTRLNVLKDFPPGVQANQLRTANNMQASIFDNKQAFIV